MNKIFIVLISTFSLNAFSIGGGGSSSNTNCRIEEYLCTAKGTRLQDGTSFPASGYGSWVTEGYAREQALHSCEMNGAICSIVSCSKICSDSSLSENLINAEVIEPE